jgi:hypothetical protein
MVDWEGPLSHAVAASLHKVSSCTVDCRLLLALAALNVLLCFCIVIGRIALASLTSFCSSTLQMMISPTSRRGKFVLFVLDLTTTTSPLTHPKLLNVLFCRLLNSTPQDDTKIPARAGKATSTARWTQMIPPMEEMMARFTLMAHQMATAQRMALMTVHLTRMTSTKATSTARWTRMVQPMEQTAIRLTSMAEQMVATSNARLTLLEQRMA